MVFILLLYVFIVGGVDLRHMTITYGKGPLFYYIWNIGLRNTIHSKYVGFLAAAVGVIKQPVFIVFFWMCPKKLILFYRKGSRCGRLSVACQTHMSPFCIFIILLTPPHPGMFT